MEWLHDIFRYIHVGGGFIGLALYWWPLLSKKGSPIHRKMGKIWTWLARVVLGTAFLGILMYLPGLIAKEHYPFSHPNSYAFLLFLAYLSIVTYVITMYAVAVLKHKKDPMKLATFLMKFSAWFIIGLSFFIVAYALILRPDAMIVLLALSPVGLTTGFGMVRYMAGKKTSPRAWLYEHLDSMIGAGIAFHTAFTVFGMARIFDLGLTGFWAAVPWVLPAIIGIPASFIWQRHYKKKFKEIPV